MLATFIEKELQSLQNLVMNNCLLTIYGMNERGPSGEMGRPSGEIGRPGGGPREPIGGPREPSNGPNVNEKSFG